MGISEVVMLAMMGHMVVLDTALGTLRRMDVACVQEIRWRGSGCRSFGAIGKRYKLFWMGSKAKTDGVGIFVAEKWVDSVVSVEKHSERVLVLKMVLGDCLLNVFTVYAPPSGKPDEEKESFRNEVFHLVSCILQNKMVVFAGDMNGHIGSSNVGYDGIWHKMNFYSSLVS